VWRIEFDTSIPCALTLQAMDRPTSHDLRRL
jgi:hypothetical protein